MLILTRTGKAHETAIGLAEKAGVAAIKEVEAKTGVAATGQA
ncbi:hypothetical protein ACFQWB_09625 [Paenibacillus thermoaerophilus]|uniref:Uncharacterized protein n=1 Tax=Paenibacillus thermoaerophilus TaxID=1215385 RepID=A0ABW2V222_9BACL|nr:hypothetical protein [Paenibacillus thermoaerophilus]